MAAYRRIENHALTNNVHMSLVAVDGLSDAERGEEASVKERWEAVDHTPEPTARRSALRFDAAPLARLRDVTRGPTSPPTTW